MTNAEVPLKDTPDLMDRSVDELEPSVRTANCLQQANIRTIGDLVKRTEADLLKLKNFGRKSLREVKELLAELGLTLRWRGPVFVEAAPSPSKLVAELLELRKSNENTLRVLRSLIRRVEKLDEAAGRVVTEIQQAQARVAPPLPWRT